MSGPAWYRGDEMNQRVVAYLTVLGLTLLTGFARGADEIVVEGGPTDSGFQAGTEASFRVVLSSPAKTDFKQFLVFADVSYIGTTAVSSAQLDLHSTEPAGQGSRAIFGGGWLIPSEAPTGVYSVKLRIEDRGERQVFLRQKIRGFAAYKKPIRIVRTTLDRTFYAPGQTIRCEVVLQNFSREEAKGLRVEFSNAHYPWISLSTKEGSAASGAQNPALAVKVLRDQIHIPPASEVRIPMSVAGSAAFLQGRQAAALGSGGPVRDEAAPPPEVNTYTVAVWNADRTVLHDMQFTTPAVVRAEGRHRPVPYGRNFTHSTNSEIDFKKYREFYPPGESSLALTLDRARTMYRPGDKVRIRGTVKNSDGTDWRDVALNADLRSADGGLTRLGPLGTWAGFKSGSVENIDAEAWNIPADLESGAYQLILNLETSEGRRLGTFTLDIAVNRLPASLMVFCAHPDDETAYGGLIRAAAEAGVPVRVVFFTGGDVGVCERYYAKPCGPNEAREFALLRMEESADAFAHLGVPRENLTFLGLPDGGSGAIWSQHVSAAKPFRSIYLATDHAPFEEAFKPTLAFARDPVIEATKQIIAEFRPEMIAAAHPDERHVDHRTANWFVIKACQDLLREQRIDPRTRVVANVSYGAGDDKRAPYRYEKFTVYLSGEAAAMKEEMNWLYQSQHGNQSEGMRETSSELSRREEHVAILDWQAHGGWNE